MHRWQTIAVAAAALVGTAGLGLAMLRPHDPNAQPMTLSAAPAAAGRYAFAVRAGAVDSLYPGADRRLILTFSNPYDFDLVVTGMRARVASTSKPGCAPIDTNLEVRDYIGRLPVRVDADDTREAGSIPLHMPNTVVDACQAAVFHIALTADATRVSP
ncbi:hypothetical protein [Mangrovihabitans endophyticus]|uniref:Uncharacterized protein n=1 Tax=Mangrovihabitans endophyticus TaxID=1751298 RepID=A0A8J3C1P7_9ACTN|nr:hypothetical protein [Mangrovihabitans endophyticus]GGL04725.1 hypothetical protein GCM10012284_44110 [Mangrovihabitans endophyticus]